MYCFKFPSRPRISNLIDQVYRTFTLLIFGSDIVMLLESSFILDMLNIIDWKIMILCSQQPIINLNTYIISSNFNTIFRVLQWTLNLGSNVFQINNKKLFCWKNSDFIKNRSIEKSSTLETISSILLALCRILNLLTYPQL